MTAPDPSRTSPLGDPGCAWLRALVARLGRSVLAERSVKIAQGRACSERLLLGVDLAALPFARIDSVLDSMGMALDGRKALEDALPEANKLLFGIEQTPERTTLKVYLEYWERLVRELRSGANKPEPALLYLGFKWDARRSGRPVIDRYICHPLLPVRDILRRIHALFPHGTRPPLAQLDGLIRDASRPLIRDSFVYVEVRDQDGARRSFDINIYKGGMTLSRAADRVRAIARHYGVEGAVEPVLESQGHQLLGHISGGIGRDREDFATLYYEVDEP